ncbi:GDSL esterase/lipase [Ananas comosus]|uniref:GDSL esterase/lipase n=1 Tax=Ananas comosus TaxID=4615 RepID=A0A199VPV7_ANACO|nr:GDSL esterase/lipase [Ananas comosus]
MERRRTKLAVAVALLLIFGLASQKCSCDVVQFIFGDSLSDVGNNNYLTKSLARAALPWYGIDFGNGMPNGRFSNGRTNVIFKNGVNYASGGGGILNETSSLFEFMRMKIGREAADKFFAEAFYVVAMGSNDFINNYLLPVYADSWNYNGDTFITYLITTLEGQLRDLNTFQLLYSLGARKLTFFGLGPMGCIPLQRILTSSGGCQQSTNKLALDFNKQSTKLLSDLASSLPNSTFKFGDAYDAFQDLINRPYLYDFNNSHGPCCSLGKIRPTLTCTPISTLCEDRSKFVFWDEYHPTDKANELIANVILKKLGYNSTNGTDNP